MEINRDPRGVSGDGSWGLWTLDALSEPAITKRRVCPQWEGTALKFVFLCICVSKEGCLGSLWGSDSNKIGIWGRNNNKTGL